MGKNIVTLFLVMVLALATSACARMQDDRDKKQLQRLFTVPDDARLVEYRGYPAMVGWGQRKGLEISAVYQLNDQQLGRFLAAARASIGWEPLPIPEAVKAKIPYADLRVPFDVQKGLYLCRTVGDNVLFAMQTESVLAADQIKDLIVGVLNADTNELFVTVKASY